MILQLDQIRAWLGLDPAGGAGAVLGYSIDSRTLRPGDLFFAIQGPRHDGHAYVEEAFRRGAVAAVVRSAYRGTGAGTLLPVDAPASALLKLATWARRKWGRTLIAVTGSSGKTTTKEMIAAFLEGFLTISKSEGNLNNEYGLPLSLLRIRDDADAAVVEIGINHPGELRPLADIAAPNIGVVTNVGAAHVGNFDSVEAIAAEKRQLIESLGTDGIAVLNADDARVAAFRTVHSGCCVTFGINQEADVRADDLHDLGAEGARFRVAGHPMITAVPGRHNVANIVAAMAVARCLGVGPDRLQDAVGRLRPVAMRGKICRSGGVTLIDDCYNANPAAVEAMLEVLRRTSARRRIAVLGEMRELGVRSRELHRRIGQAVSAAGLDYLVAVGGDAVEIAAAADVPGEFHDYPQEAARALAGQLRPGDALLLKASRGVGLERVRDALLAEMGRTALAERIPG